MRRLVLVLKIPAKFSRHQLAAWREPCRIGDLSLGQGVWAVPDVPVFADGTARALAPTDKAGGQALTPDATGHGPEYAAHFRTLFTAARSAGRTEFRAACGEFEDEIAKKVRLGAFTLAELDEEERSLERLRRRHRDLTAWDVSGAPEAAEAAVRLKTCAALCEDHAGRVVAVLHEGGDR
ncbi:Chromate resistance protein ChrB [Streptomyces sp. NPDC096033]|uniref:Chromate resistance protein ChrB n=1 Tax=Streptomyces sp. NPDC096033 TaxID=3366071 RepID=UPI00382B3316